MGKKNGIEIGAQGPDGGIIRVAAGTDTGDRDGVLKIGFVQEDAVDRGGQPACKVAGNFSDDFRHQKRVTIASDAQGVMDVQQEIGVEPEVGTQVVDRRQGCQHFQRGGRHHFLVGMVGQDGLP